MTPKPGVRETGSSSLRQDRRFIASSQCTNATLESTRTFCAQLARAEGELAKSLAFAKLEQEIADLRSARAERGNDAHGVVGGDVQSALIAQIANLKISTVQAALSAISVLMVESGACFFLWLSMNYLQASRSAPAAQGGAGGNDESNMRAQMRQMQLRNAGSASDFVEFVSECVVLSRRHEYGVSELIDSYKLWCGRRGKSPIADAHAELGVKAFCEAGGLKIRSRGRRMVVSGIYVKQGAN